MESLIGLVNRIQGDLDVKLSGGYHELRQSNNRKDQNLS